MGRRYSTLRDSTASSVKPARRPCAGKPERPRFFEVSTRIRAIGVIAPEGEVLDMLVQSRRDSRAALSLRGEVPSRRANCPLSNAFAAEVRFALDSPAGGRWTRTCSTAARSGHGPAGGSLLRSNPCACWRKRWATCGATVRFYRLGDDCLRPSKAEALFLGACLARGAPVASGPCQRHSDTSGISA